MVYISISLAFAIIMNRTFRVFLQCPSNLEFLVSLRSVTVSLSDTNALIGPFALFTSDTFKTIRPQNGRIARTVTLVSQTD